MSTEWLNRVVFALVVTVALVLVGVMAANAQDTGDPFPWLFESSQETVEFSVDINRQLTSDSYIFMIVVVGEAEGSVPYEFEASLQQYSNRFAAEKSLELQGYVPGIPYLLMIPVTSLQLKDPTYGTLDPASTFNPNNGPVSIALIHAWDSEAQMEVKVLLFGVAEFGTKRI